MAQARILLTPEAATYLGKRSPSTLEKWRHQRVGPRFLRLGVKSVGYDIRDLDAWIEEQKSKGHPPRPARPTRRRVPA
jgi:predicted DNA-binding transcriptional regulator AlpA